ncbi:DUF3352 domain-containing protein [Plebeiibacterium marinum]|uniref:DUF3352 domain-containing protein n=1 Tax=Plebeiibacterium marinum TaxID=2992111 RepID=A0AAE3SLR5_9BACT|nr:DUF3352 domain-containing protein [Plebeiobacterium marinum]MCW3807967.1 DUF3352 domain-containing protein [Plebeiobacterium marinum]
MKQFFKFFGYLLLAIIIVIIGSIVYLQLGNKNQQAPISVVPQDAMLILETDNLSETMVDITQTNYWKSIIESEVLKEFKEALLSYDETIEKNKWLKPILKNQRLTFSLHTNNTRDLEYLIVSDIKKFGKLNIIPKLTSMLKIPAKKSVINSLTLYSIYLKEYKLSLHLSSVNNLLLCSSSYQLLEQAIRQKSHLPEHIQAKQNHVNSYYTSDLFNIYTNNNLIHRYFSDNPSTFLNSLAFSALGGTFSTESFTMEGYTSLYDSIASPFIPLKHTTANTRSSENVIPSDASLYINFNITDFSSFYKKFLSQYSSIDPIGYQTYTAGLKLTESYMGINLKEDFLSWLSGEISFIQFKPLPNAHEDDFLAVVKASDIDFANQKLTELAQKIKNRTSFRFNQSQYKNFNINYLNIRGFFKLFMGGFFHNRSKPYYTIIDDYILFSNSSDLLEYSIDNYLVGNTLARNKDFQSFMGNFNNKCQFTTYVNMPRLYDRVYYYSNTNERNELSPYRRLIQNIGWVGFQLSPEQELLKTKLYAQTFESPKTEYHIDIDLSSAENLIIDEFEQLEFKIDLGKEFDNFEGNLSYYLPHPEKVQDSILVHEGNMDNGMPDGLWRSYFYSGNVKSVVNYNDGQADGTAIFYYNNNQHVIRAEIEFDDDVIDGSYKEFYTNGNIKASIEFRDGQRWGEAMYYFRDGQVKTTGEFKKGKQSGKWKYYSKSGELINKENW